MSPLAWTINVLYMAGPVPCQGCGMLVRLARDWLGVAWRDARGRHYCAVSIPEVRRDDGK